MSLPDRRLPAGFASNARLARLWHLVLVAWIVVGGALVLVGATITVAAGRGAHRDESQPPGAGLVVATGLGLAGWGVVALVVGLFRIL